MTHSRGPFSIETNSSGRYIWDDNHDWPGRASRLICKVGGVGGGDERDAANAEFIKAALERAGKEGK